jgi:hypothetical protein
MSKLRSSINSILLVVGFLVLTAIVTVLYGGSDEQKVKMEQNVLYQKARLVTDTIWAATQGIVAINLSKNTGSVAQGINDLSSAALDSSTAASDTASETGFWSKMITRIKEEWNNGDTAGGNNYGVSDLNSDNSNINSFFNWQKTATGAELIFRTKSGGEYKLPLPFKFLSQ